MYKLVHKNHNLRKFIHAFQERKKFNPLLFKYRCFGNVNKFTKNAAGKEVITKYLTLYHTILTFSKLRKAFENVVGKRENASNQHFLLDPQCFLNYQGQ